MTGAAIEVATPADAHAPAVRAVVLSDIHATTTSRATNVARDTADDPDLNALTAALDHLRTEIGSADMILCPGDLVHRGDTEPMEWVWEVLHTAAHDLCATLIGAAGNHDLLLEPTDNHRPDSAVKALRPKFPYPDRLADATYWAHDVALVDGPDWRVVSLNSCSAHGGYDRDAAEYGWLREECLGELEAMLERSEHRPAVNICMVHHHPVEWTDSSDRRTRHLRQGDLLVTMLDERPERWMLVHGHKHHPALRYLGAGSCGPVQLSAGSIGANLLGDSGTSVRNQLHVVDFEPAARETLGLALAGTVRSLDWRPGEGWTDASSDSGLPAVAGFGYRRDGLDLAHSLMVEARAMDKRSWRWEELVAQYPRCGYLTPRDRDELFIGVRQLGGGVVNRPDDGFVEVTFS